MKNISSNKLLGWGLIIVAIIVFSLTLYNALYVSGGETGGAFISEAAAVASSSSTIPVRLTIPSISVDAKVQQVGLTKKGALGIPTNFSDVAWYKYGPVPGAKGNAIIDGHLDNAISLPGVFKHLSDINIGDDIFVSNASGMQMHFKVNKKESIDYDATSTGNIFGPTDGSNLILITCDGTWNQSVKQYSNRLIVFSTLIK
jgi:sortase A